MAFPESQQVLSLEVAVNCTARQAVELAIEAGLKVEYPDFDVALAPLGVHGIRVENNSVLAAGDRVEIYRPLQQDPMELRRKRAALESSRLSTRRK